MIIASEGGVIGGAAIEVHGDSGLLRSVVVDPAARGRGVGVAIVDAAVDQSLGVITGEVVLEDAGWGCPAECSVGSVVIVEMHEPGVGAGPLGF